MSEKKQGSTGLAYDGRCVKHETGAGHPERPARMGAVHDALTEAGLVEKLTRLPVQPCEQADVLACHTESYVKRVKQDIEGGARQLSTGDTDVGAQSLDVARIAVGGVLAAVDAVCAGRVQNAFCAMRPPGHHATPSRGMGFCLFNNIAIGARYAQRKHGIGKVLIVDWDVHHGNGTQDIFYQDESVFYFSTHQAPWYPGTGGARETGQGKGLGTTLNQPLSAGSGRAEIVGAFAERLVPAANRFRPELVMISAGFDSRLGDPLGQFTLGDEDFAELTRIVAGIASDHSGGRLISVLEGGYHLEGLGKASTAHVEALLSRE